MKSKTTTNIYLLMAATFLTMSFALPAAAQHVKMSFSGTASNTFNGALQPDSSNAEYNLTGTGALGPFTLRLVNAEPNSPTSSDTCSGPTKLYLQVDTGAGIFRFQDGSLLYVHLTRGSDCIDFAANHALCIRILQITGGTGRFKNASGTLMLTETVIPMLADTSNNPVFFAAAGKVNGVASGVAMEADRQQEQQ